MKIYSLCFSKLYRVPQQIVSLSQKDDLPERDRGLALRAEALWLSSRSSVKQV
jgi:hypothetical protein